MNNYEPSIKVQNSPLILTPCFCGELVVYGSVVSRYASISSEFRVFSINVFSYLQQFQQQYLTGATKTSLTYARGTFTEKNSQKNSLAHVCAKELPPPRNCGRNCCKALITAILKIWKTGVKQAKICSDFGKLLNLNGLGREVAESNNFSVCSTYNGIPKIT